MQRRLLAIARVAAVGAVVAVSWQMLRIDDRATVEAALGYLQIALLLAALVWSTRALNLAALIAPVGVAIATQQIIHACAWIMWCATVIGLAAMVRGVGASPLPEARVHDE